MKKKILSWFNSEVSRVEFYIVFGILAVMLALQLLELDKTIIVLENIIK